MKSSQIAIGTEVAYAPSFLKSLGPVGIEEIAAMRGEVKEIRKRRNVTLVRVLWDGLPEPNTHRISSLVAYKSAAFHAAP
jgi:hypothetical protein